MTGRESGERSAVPECSLILFSIHCAQRLEAPEGSPARSLDALSVQIRQRGSNRRPGRLHVRAVSGIGGELVPAPKTRRWVSGVEWVDWWVGLRRSGRLGTLAVYLPAAARGLEPVIRYSFGCNLITASFIAVGLHLYLHYPCDYFCISMHFYQLSKLFLSYLTIFQNEKTKQFSLV